MRGWFSQFARFLQPVQERWATKQGQLLVLHLEVEEQLQQRPVREVVASWLGVVVVVLGWVGVVACGTVAGVVAVGTRGPGWLPGEAATAAKDRVGRPDMVCTSTVGCAPLGSVISGRKLPKLEC